MPGCSTVSDKIPEPACKWLQDPSARRSAVHLQKNRKTREREESIVSSGYCYSRAQVSELFPLLPKIVPNSLWITGMINISLDHIREISKPLLLNEINSR